MLVFPAAPDDLAWQLLSIPVSPGGGSATPAVARDQSAGGSWQGSRDIAGQDKLQQWQPTKQLDSISSQCSLIQCQIAIMVFCNCICQMFWAKVAGTTDDQAHEQQTNNDERIRSFVVSQPISFKTLRIDRLYILVFLDLHQMCCLFQSRHALTAD